MKALKYTIASLVLLATIYFGLMGAIHLVLENNKDLIETEIAAFLGVQKVTVEGFQNLPFLSIQANGFSILMDDGSYVYVDSANIRYSVLRMIQSGQVVRAITGVSVGSVTLFSTIPRITSMIEMLQKGQTNTGENTPFTGSFKVDVRSLNISLGLLGMISSDLQLQDIRMEFNQNKLNLEADLKMKVFLSTNIEYLNADTKLVLDITDLSNRTGTGEIGLELIDFGGTRLFSQKSLKFSFETNEVIFDWDDPSLSNLIRIEQGALVFKLASPFLMNYSKYTEHQLFEYIFPTNQYIMETEAVYRDDMLVLNTSIKSADLTKTYGMLEMHGEGDRFYVKGFVETPKYGLIKADVSFKPDAQLPEGTVEMRDIAFLDGLKFGGIATIKSHSNTVIASVKGLQLNSGLVGDAGVTIVIQTNGIVDLHSMKGPYQAFVDGSITNTELQIFIRLKNADGEFVVKNIHMDFFNLGKGKYTGLARLYTDNGVFKIDGDLEGFYYGRKFFETKVSLSNTYLYFHKLDFLVNQIFITGGMDILSPDKLHTDIVFDGNVNWLYRHYMAVKGEVNIDNDKGVANGRFDLGGLIQVGIYGSGPWLNVGIDLRSYPMKRFDFPGYLSGSADLKLYAGSLYGVNLNLDYPIDSGYKFKLYLRSEKKKGGGDIYVDHCAISFNSDSLLSTTGWMSENGKRLKGKIDFVRGYFSFDASFDDVVAALSFHDFEIQDLIKKGQKYFATSAITLKGKLTDPDIHGSALVYQIVNSPNAPKKMILTVDDFYKAGNIYTLQNLKYFDRDFWVAADGKVTMKKNYMYISAYGKASLMGSIDGNFNITYKQEPDSQTVSYKLNTIKINEIPIGEIEGGVIINGGQYKFYRLANKNGVNGTISDQKNHSKIELDILTDKVWGNVYYEVKNKKVESSSIVLNADLKLLSFLKFIRKIDGQAKLTLKASGSGSEPLFDGDLRIYNLSLALEYTKTQVMNQNFTLAVKESKLVFAQSVLPTSSGDLVLNGYIDTSHIPVPYLDLQISSFYEKPADLILDVDTPLMKIQGNLRLKTIRIYGSPPVLNLTGDVVAQNLFLSVGLTGGGGQSSGPPDPYDLFARLKWNMPISIGNGVRFANQLIDTTLVSGDKLTILGSLWDNSFTLKGEVTVTRGTFSFIGRDFMIQTGEAVFSGKPGYPLPFISLNTLSKYKDSSGENIDVFLTFEGDISDIKLKDFYSMPDRPKSDLYALLGFDNTLISTTNEVWSEVGKKIIVSGIGMADDILIFNPISMAMRKTLGLDFFMIRSGVVETISKGMFYGSTNIDPLSLIGGTSFSMGKYLFSNLFLEYELTLQRDPYSDFGLKTLHSVGLLFDFYNFNFGGRFQPILESVKQTEYEFKFEFNVHQKF
ncbi:MAG: hypothetical protein A2Y33_08135 [Spirochaetes bacterium GWF1_51_8]|nr:MAG: hypothetical protein A2Y33_08135 [Spirochaetes bacterium GWF1_51_8]